MIEEMRRKWKVLYHVGLGFTAKGPANVVSVHLAPISHSIALLVPSHLQVTQLPAAS